MGEESGGGGGGVGVVFLSLAKIVLINGFKNVIILLMNLPFSSRGLLLAWRCLDSYLYFFF